MTLIGQKHVVKCRCILPQFKRHKDPIFHEFTVFSAMIDGTFQESIAQCNNCGIVHRIVDFCKSEILASKENTSSTRTIDEICLSFPSDLENLLKTCSVDLATFQYVEFILQHKIWGAKVLLSKEEAEGYVTGKSLIVVNDRQFKVEPFTHSMEIKRA